MRTFLFTCAFIAAVYGTGLAVEPDKIHGVLLFEFGTVDETGLLTHTTTIPWQPGVRYGWQATIYSKRPNVTLREVLILPAPSEWIDSSPAKRSEHVVTIEENIEDGRILTREVKLDVRKPLRYGRTYKVIESDPAGKYILRLYVNGELAREVTFTLKKKRYMDLAAIPTKEGEVTEISLSDLDPDDPLTMLFQATAGKQAAGLDGAKVTVHSVTEHQEFLDATPQKGHKLIAVDVTIANFNPDGFGMAGIQLVDGEKQEAESYGGDPYQVYLDAKGNIHDKQGYQWWDANEDAKEVRIFLVYSAPKRVKKIGLGYWNKIIVDRPYVVTQPDNNVLSRIDK